MLLLVPEVQDACLFIAVSACMALHCTYQRTMTYDYVCNSQIIRIGE
jgi:hypothetical protein